jgi:two-component system chemotaxis response regulator CheB
MHRHRVLVIDESSRWRQALKEVLEDAEDIQPVGAVADTVAGGDRVRSLRPEFVLLSANADGDSPAEFTRAAIAARPHLGVLLLSRPNAGTEDHVIEALEVGAFDLVMKCPDTQLPGGATDVMARRILPKVRTFSASLFSRMARKLSGSGPRITRPLSEVSRMRALRSVRGEGNGSPPEVVVVGVSTGGPEALSRLLPAFGGSFPLPILVVQHMPKRFISSLATALDRRTQLPVRVPAEGTRLTSGSVWIAPGGSQLLLDRDGGGRLVARLSKEPAENGFCPSADVLFQSAAEICGGRTVALILTGMGRDGSQGLSELKAAGAHIIAQDEETSVVWGMPGHAVRGGLVSEVLPIDDIAGRISEWVTR